MQEERNVPGTGERGQWENVCTFRELFFPFGLAMFRSVTVCNLTHSRVRYVFSRAITCAAFWHAGCTVLAVRVLHGGTGAAAEAIHRNPRWTASGNERRRHKRRNGPQGRWQLIGRNGECQSGLRNGTRERWQANPYRAAQRIEQAASQASRRGVLRAYPRSVAWQGNQCVAFDTLTRPLSAASTPYGPRKRGVSNGAHCALIPTLQES